MCAVTPHRCGSGCWTRASCVLGPVSTELQHLSVCLSRASRCQICYITLLSPTPSPNDFLLPKEIRNLCEPWLSCDKGMDLSELVFSTFRRIHHGHLKPQRGLDRIVHISWLSWGSRIWGVPKLPVPSVSSSLQPPPAHQG